MLVSEMLNTGGDGRPATTRSRAKPVRSAAREPACGPPAARLRARLRGPQIQIQIESLHTRLDEIGEMTNAASLYSRTFSQHVYDERAPRDAGGFSFALSTRQALDQGRRAPIAH